MHHYAIPYLGDVFAGKSVPIDGWPLIRYETLPLTRPPRSGEKLAIYGVIGDSLKDAGIFDGDEVIFKFTNEAHTGDLVIATTPFGTTIKFFFLENGGIILRSANSINQDQTWEIEDVRIVGVVTEVRRIINGQ